MINPTAIATIAALVALAMRGLKAGSLDEYIPARFRPPLAVALGLCGAVVSNLALGVPWNVAILEALLGSAAAMGAHDLGIESLRGGRELFR